MTIVEMNVHMDCPGCESKIRKSLRKLEGVDSVDIDMGLQKVTVTGYIDQGKVLRTVRKTGRYAELWPFPYNQEYNSYAMHYNNPTTYYNQSSFQYQSQPTTYYNQNRYEYQNDPWNNYNNQNHYEYENDDYEYQTSTNDHYMSQPAAGAVSSYNYLVHGYNGHDHGYYREPPHSTIIDDRARAVFNDENTHACSIM